MEKGEVMGAISLTKETFQNSIQSGVALVDFWAPWCGPCRVQLPIVDNLADELNGGALIAKVNVDEQPELASQYSVRSIPTLLLFKNGKLVDSMVGINQKHTLEEKITNILKN
nr:thioredoxin [Paenibacillus terrae]